jgi:hypothetical protein
MAGIFLVISRTDFDGGEERVRKDLSLIHRRLLPIGASGIIPTMNVGKKDCLLITVPDAKIYSHLSSVCSGAVEDLPAEWWKQNLIPPSASFFSSVNDSSCLISSNSTASRSVWYYFDENQLVVSTSQKAIVAWIGSFESNPQAISWMLATGNLGPGNAWDARIKHLGAGEDVVLSRGDWNLSVKIRDNNKQHSSNLSREEYVDLLNSTLDSVFRKAKFNLDNSILTLSGGYDSRAVLYYLVKSGVNINTITWGLSSAVNDQLTDSNVASKIASRLKVSNEYYVTDFKDRTFDPLFNRFLQYGEGRLDHINSYMDGFRMWENLFDKGVRNIVRADEAFGWLPSKTEQDVRISLDLHLMEDNANMIPLQHFNIEPQKYPAFCQRDLDESLETWRDRLYRQFRIPYVLSSLHDLIHPFVEVYNPLLHEDIVAFSKDLPDDLRTNKKIYAKFVADLINDIPFAKKASIPEPAAILKSAKIVSLMLDELNSQDSRNILNSTFINWVQSHLTVDDHQINNIKNSWTLWFKQQIPWRVKKMLRKDFIKYSADFNQLAFRTVIIVRMHRIMAEEASLLKVK